MAKFTSRMWGIDLEARISVLLIARDVITGIKEGEKAHSQNKFRGLDWGVCIEFCCFFLTDLLFHESKG